MTVLIISRDKLKGLAPILSQASSLNNPEFHALLRHVGKEIGTDIVLNTSFNVKGQPIVNTAEEAMETFLATDIDMLFLGNCCITNDRRRLREITAGHGTSQGRSSPNKTVENHRALERT